jgi:phosphate transport system substrate-binding protein
MNRNTNPPFSEPTLTVTSSDAVFPSLCAYSNTVDTVVVDRRILPEELELCHRTNKHIAEVKLGHEAIVLARSNLYDPPRLSTRSIFLALAREIPNPSHPEELIKNPNVTWDQVDSALPSERIEVSGPPLSSPTGIAFRDLILKAGCLAIPTIASLKETDPERFEEVCGSVRTDGVYRVSEWSQHTGSNPSNYVGYLQANPEAIALLAYGEDPLRYLNLNAGSIDGVTPNRSIIRSGSYVGARVLYLYANTGAPHMRELVFAIWSSFGASGDMPLISVDDAEQRNIRQQVLTLPDLKF